MTGSAQAAYVIPIVAVIVLFVWLFLVFWADSHPQWGKSEVPGQARPAQLPEGISIPRPRVEGQGVPEQPAQPASTERASR